MFEGRYDRNIGSITLEEQSLLRTKRVFIAGAGGLGGNVLSYLLRAGVGNITITDPDVFDVTNLNRQLLSNEANIGRLKSIEAKKYSECVNSEINVSALDVFIDESNAEKLIKGHDLVIDCLDSINSRKILAKACDCLGIVMLHGAISGWNAQIALFPESMALSRMDLIYPDGSKKINRSCLSFIPSVCASIQSSEAIKYLLGRETDTDSLLFIDLLENEFERIPFYINNLNKKRQT